MLSARLLALPAPDAPARASAIDRAIGLLPKVEQAVAADFLRRGFAGLPGAHARVIPQGGRDQLGEDCRMRRARRQQGVRQDQREPVSGFTRGWDGKTGWLPARRPRGSLAQG